MSDTMSDVQRVIREKVGEYLDAIEKQQHGDFTAKVVPFNDLWKWAGYSTKGNARRQLEKVIASTELIITTDKNPLGGRPTEEILLTVDAAKKFLLKAQTPEGDAACDYFIQCEREWRQCRNAIRDGHIAVEETATGRRIDNSKNIQLCKDRLAHVEATKQTAQAIKACGGDKGDQVRKNILVTKTATGGLTPAQFKEKIGFKDDPASARSFMGPHMLGGATMSEGIFQNLLREHNGDMDATFTHYQNLMRGMLPATKYVQDDVLQKPLCPDDARKTLASLPALAAPPTPSSIAPPPPTVNNHANTINNYFASVSK